MVTARALVERNEKTLTMMPRPEEPAPRSVQLYGTAPGTLGEAVRRLIGEHGVQHVDLNFGCPVPKVTRKGGGAALPVRRRLFGDIVSSAVAAAGLDGVPLTVKFRMGVDDGLLTYLEAGRIAEDAGAAAVALHARTAEQRYSGSARWGAIGELKAAVTTVPVLGNGDIWEAGDAVRMMAETGCDGVVIGRGCLGRPWLFADLVEVFAGRPAPAPRSLGEVTTVLRRHADLLVETAGEVNAMRSMRRHSGWYLQGYPVGSEVRRRLGLVETRAQLDEHLDGLDPTLRQEPGTTALPRGVHRRPPSGRPARGVALARRRPGAARRRRAARQRRLSPDTDVTPTGPSPSGRAHPTGGGTGAARGRSRCRGRRRCRPRRGPSGRRA